MIETLSAYNGGICAALKLLEFKGNLAVSKKHYPKEEWIDIVKSGTYLD